MPAATGSLRSVNTIGIRVVASLAACVAAYWLVTIRSTPDFDERRRGGGHRVELAFGESDVEPDVTAFLESELSEPRLEPLDGRVVGGPRFVQDADAMHATGRLSQGVERDNGEQRDEDQRRLRQTDGTS